LPGVLLIDLLYEMKDATDSAYLLEASVSYLNRVGFHLCRGDAAILNCSHSGFAEK